MLNLRGELSLILIKHFNIEQNKIKNWVKQFREPAFRVAGSLKFHDL